MGLEYGGTLVCDSCKVAADNPADEGGGNMPHPDNCGCPCQHQPKGAWKGNKADA